ncbi:MAG: HU family DNA-binding protein [Bryobacteraceae bacterium]
MRKTDLAHKLAESASTSPAEAADRIDLAVHRIVKKLRAGKTFVLPGLGYFRPGEGKDPSFEFKEKPHKRVAKSPKKGEQ